MKKKLISVVTTGVLCASMVIPAMAAGEVGGAIPTMDGTEVWAGITLEDSDPKIKVEVPTLFAFVVNGVVKTSDKANNPVQSVITKADGDASVLLPNIKVKVDTASSGAGGNGVYHLETAANGNYKFVNYSTKADATAGVDGRKGMDVKILGSIKNEGTAVSRNYWTHVADVDDTTGKTDEFKQYTLEIENEKFSKVEIDGSFTMENAITLPAPDLAVVGVDATTGYAKVGNEFEAAFNVHVGGQRGQYSQVEESAKVGTIVWTIQADQMIGADTAPDKDYLEPTP